MSHTFAPKPHCFPSFHCTSSAHSHTQLSSCHPPASSATTRTQAPLQPPEDSQCTPSPPGSSSPSASRSLPSSPPSQPSSRYCILSSFPKSQEQRTIHPVVQPSSLCLSHKLDYRHRVFSLCHIKFYGASMSTKDRSNDFLSHAASSAAFWYVLCRNLSNVSSGASLFCTSS
jgi:hypothetical protein